jgi:hypothetical protein
MTEAEVKYLIKDWHRNRAKNETDPFYRFMCHWICFNAWLDHQSGEYTDRAMINWLKLQTPTTSDMIASYEAMKLTTVGGQNLKALVSMGPILDSRGRGNITMSGVNDRDNIIEAIYKIRCNLFHGGKRLSSTRDTKLVACVNHIMTKWIDDLIAGW